MSTQLYEINVSLSDFQKKETLVKLITTVKQSTLRLKNDAPHWK